MWLGAKRGYLTDWVTQQWVKATGRRVNLRNEVWLSGPIGKPTGIGPGFFQQLAEEEHLVLLPGSGLLADFSQLASERCHPEKIDPAVVRFYEHAAEYEMHAWSEWAGAFKPFGWLLALIFSRRLQQLNVPLSGLDTSRGITSEVLNLVEPVSQQTRFTAWVRQMGGNRNVLYAGSYSLCSVPGYSGKCVKVVFPLPNGNAIVCMYPESLPDGVFRLTSSGRRFGDPGFYFTVHGDSAVWARYVRTMQETITVYARGKEEVRADHALRIWGVVFLRLHYRLRRKAKDKPSQSSP